MFSIIAFSLGTFLGLVTAENILADKTSADLPDIDTEYNNTWNQWRSTYLIPTDSENNTWYDPLSKNATNMTAMESFEAIRNVGEGIQEFFRGLINCVEKTVKFLWNSLTTGWKPFSEKVKRGFTDFNLRGLWFPVEDPIETSELLEGLGSA